jgi:hypothetical protein
MNGLIDSCGSRAIFSFSRTCSHMSKKKIVDDAPPPPTFDAGAHVRLSSNDEHTFIVDRNCVKPSAVLSAVLSTLSAPHGAEPSNAQRDQHLAVAASAGISVESVTVGSTTLAHIKVGCMSGKLLERVLQFTHYKYAATWDAIEARSPFTFSSTEAPAKARERMELLAACSLLAV